jgi:hypothetical protein
MTTQKTDETRIKKIRLPKIDSEVLISAITDEFVAVKTKKLNRCARFYIWLQQSFVD